MTSPGPALDDLRPLAARSSGRMLSDQMVDTLLGLLMSVAGRITRHAAGAGITVAAVDAPSVTLAATSPLVERLDALQYDLGEGPCLTAWRDRAVVRVDDLATETRWPRWVAAAASSPVASVLSAPLVVGDAVVGATKVYGDQPRSFDHEVEATLRLFAAQAAILVSQAQAYRHAGELTDDLHQVLRQRDDINRACGVLMHREGVPADAAFAYLTSLAERERRTVHESAVRILRRFAAAAS